MSDTNDKDQKPSGRKPLSLKGGAGGGTVRQSFSGGRSKSVVVETKKRRIIGGPSSKAASKTDAPAKSAAPKIDQDAAAAKRLGLSKEEYLKRKSALTKAQAEQEARETTKRAEQEARKARMDAEKQALEEKRKAEEAARKAAVAAKAEPAKPAPAPSAPTRSEPPKKQDNPRTTLESMGGRVKKARNDGGSDRSRGSRDDRSRRKGKLTIASALAGNEERQRSLASVKRARQKEKERRTGGSKNSDKVVREVIIPEAITIADLANRMAERAADVVKYMMKQGEMMKMNDVLDADTAQLIVEDFGHTVKRVSEADVEENFLIDDTPSDESKRKPRPPVIAVMGHVDHGKTSLIDALRTTDVASGEAGGITQHIGAYQLQLKTGEKITVLDTPGHAAFSEMRTRGAQAVDIVILVVAADDSVKPQTIESIKHAQASETPIIVAINKVDVYEANPTKVQQDLLQHNVITEQMSGETQAVEVSAKNKTGLDELVEAITLQAEILDLKANPERTPDGLVIESQIVKGRGPVATFLVKRGTLKRGDIIVAGEYWGKVKAMTDERNATVKQATPSMPVEVMGLDGAPAPGEPFAVVESEQKAREITEYRQRKNREASSGGSAAVSMEQMMARLADKSASEMAILVKADVQGSAEAIKSSAERLGNEEVKARVVSTGVGGISESDVMLAKSSNAPIIAFNVRANRQAKALAEKEGVEIRYYSIIYDLLDDIRGVLEGMLAPEKRETFIGYAEILEVFNISKLGKIGGSRVTEGKIQRGAGIRLLRDDVVIHEGEISTLKRFKDEVEKVNAGMECGIGFLNYFDLRKGDQIECFTVEMIDRKLESTI